MLVGRAAELAEIDRLLAAAVAGHGGALAIRGPAGIGKSALVEHAAAASTGMRVLRGIGIESEAELAFGVLHMLFYPYLDRIDGLPGPQAAALRAAFGESAEPEASRFLVGAGALTLLAELAAETPTLLLIDDAQWVDQSSSDALLFAARRFGSDAIAVLFAVRDGAQPFPTPGLETMRLAGLPQAAAADLLDRRAPGLTVPGRARVLAESAGNPLALIELGAARRTAETTGHTDPVHEVGPLPVTRLVQERFRAQIAALPERTRTMLLVAAADTGAELDAIRAVAAVLGLSDADLAPAEQVDLITVSTDRLAFRHPLIRAAVYRNAPHHQRITVHRSFALVLTAAKDADRRAWHLAAATTEPDEQVAAVLEQTAVRAQRRGGAMAVSSAYDRAGRLSVDVERKAHRFLKAARAAYDAGKPDRAIRLAVEAASLTGNRGIVAEATHIRAQVEYERTGPAADAELAMQAAALVLDSDPERAVSMLAEAVCAARDAGVPELLRQGVELMNAVRLPADSGLRIHLAAQIAWGDMLTGHPERAVAAMAAQMRSATGDSTEYLHKMVAAFSGVMLADDAGTIDMMDEMIDGTRAIGALQWIPYALELRALAEALSGRFQQARSTVAEGISLSTELGMGIQVDTLRAIEIWLTAVGGDEARATELATEVLPELSSRHRTNTALASWGLAIADLAAGRYDTAIDRLDEICTGPAARDFLIRAVPDHVEAAIRGGVRDRAADHLPAFENWAEHVENPSAAALSRRCRALLDESDGAETHYRAALTLHEQQANPYDRARTQLVFGEWLRRRRRRSDARAQLVEAMATFDTLGAGAWGARVRTELAALGEQSVVQARTDPLAQLTPQESQVVRLAAAGFSNKEIGAKLFLSPRTIGHHLYRAYPKLGVTRRTELAQFRL